MPQVGPFDGFHLVQLAALLGSLGATSCSIHYYRTVQDILRRCGGPEPVTCHGTGDDAKSGGDK